MVTAVTLCALMLVSPESRERAASKDREGLRYVSGFMTQITSIAPFHANDYVNRTLAPAARAIAKQYENKPHRIPAARPPPELERTQHQRDERDRRDHEQRGGRAGERQQPSSRRPDRARDEQWPLAGRELAARTHFAPPGGFGLVRTVRSSTRQVFSPTLAKLTRTVALM